MKSKSSSKARKSPWIPPPARTTKLSSKKDNKVRFISPTSYQVDPVFDHWITPSRSLESEIKETDEKLEQLNLSQRRSLESSSQRLEKLKREVLDDLLESSYIAKNESHRAATPESPPECKISSEDVCEQKTALVYKLRDFEANSSMLRKMLKKSPTRSSDVVDSRKMSAGTAFEKQEKGSSKSDALQAEDRIKLLESTIKDLQDEQCKLETQNKHLESNRATLQRQLHKHESSMTRMKANGMMPVEDFRLTDHIQQMETEMELMKVNFSAERDTLQKIIRMERKKATKNSEINSELKSNLVKKKGQISQLTLDYERHKAEIGHLVQVRDLAETELSVLRERIEELEVIIAKLGSKKEEVVERPLQENGGSSYNKISKNFAEEMDGIKGNITLMQDNDSKEKSNSKELLLDVSSGVEAHHSFLKTELDQQFSDQSKLILQLTNKIEKQAEQIKALSETKGVPLSSDNTLYSNRIEALNKKIHELERKNFEISVTLTKNEEALQYSQLRLEEKSADFQKSKEQNEIASSDARKQVEMLQDKLLNLEKQMQILKSEHEVQLSRAQSEIFRLKSDKSEVEKNCNAKLSELKDRLDHAQDSNRSLQNYISFLKSSYANVFSDSALSTLGTPPKVV